MEYQEIRYEVDDGIATITLNRPEHLNAFTSSMLREWESALLEARDDDAVKVVIVTGAGRAFCAGVDVSGAAPELIGGDAPPAARRNSLRYTVHQVMRTLQLLDKPYIAALNGPAAGAGLDMALMADIRFAAEGARFTTAYLRVGLVPGDGGAYFLPRLVGLAKALELLWTSDPFTAEEALEMGIVSRVYPRDELIPETRAFAARLAAGPGVAIQLTKRLAYRSLDASLDQALDLAQSSIVIAHSTEDAEEGPRAFQEKRAPNFQGR